MGQCLIDQYLARIGYVSASEQQILELGPNPRPDTRLANIGEVQTKILNQLTKQHAAQQQAPSSISLTPPAETSTPDLGEEASPYFLPGTFSTASTPRTEVSCQLLELKHERTTPPLSPPTMAEILAGLYSELEHREKTCLDIECQIEACQKEIQTHPSKQQKIEKGHSKRIAESLKPVHGSKQKNVYPAGRKEPQTAEEAEIEEMREIYQQYDCGSAAPPTAESVDAFFVIIADTETRFKKAEGAKRAAKRREARLQQKLYGARCAVFEMEDEIEEVGGGALVQECRGAEGGGKKG